MRDIFLRRWHHMLGLPRQAYPSWHRDRLREELKELRSAKSTRHRLSETSDVFFAISRARFDGIPIRKLPSFDASHAVVYAYMVGKYTSRWLFYRSVGYLSSHRNSKSICEVVNPSKDRKLIEVACRHDIDPAAFTRIGRRLRRNWPFLN